MKSIDLIKIGRIIILLFVVSILCVAQICPVFAAGESNGISENSSYNLDKSIDSRELERFTDHIFDKYMKEYNIPGGVISVVKDGKVVLSKGYGYADIKKKTPINPSKTMFRIGSATKLFTANGVMQLMEKGKINLNQDVNTYLKEFKIKNQYPNKVTMAQLLTHTSGIDSDIINDLSKNKSDVKPISQFLKNRMLPVVREPGQIIQYSSYGMALAGCIVEETSGMSCNDFISKNIFEPLEMKNTNFKFNPSGLAKGYVVEDGVLKDRELEGYFNLYPVGGIVSTADDMAKFMIAHLNNGVYKGKRILNEETAIDMHSHHAGLDSAVPGTCYGFAEGLKNGKRTAGHPGYSPDGFLTELCLIPENNTGIFISVNQGGNNYFPQDFINYFIDHYFPYTEDNFVKNSLHETPDKKIEGTYRFGEYTRTTIMKGEIFGAAEDAKVSVNNDGTINIEETDPVTKENLVVKAVQVVPMTFRSSDGEYIVFKQNNKGEVEYMARTSNSWHGTYERINWYDKNFFQTGLFMGCCGIFLIELLLFIILSVRRLILKHKEDGPLPRVVKYLNYLVGINSLLNLMFYGISMMTWGERLRYGVPIDVKLILVVPIISIIITIALTVGSIIAFRKKAGSLIFRINVSIFTFICIVFIWFYNYYNFLGFKY